MQQMQPMMAAYYPTNVTTDHIQQYLDENKSLILKIVESQNSGKMSECAENQAKLQRNLMYLAAIADSQPPQPRNIHTQYAAASGILPPPTGSHYHHHQQAQVQAQAQMTPQSLMAAARSSMLYGAQPYPSLQQQQQHALHNQLGVGSGGLMLQGEPHGASGGFPDLVRGSNSAPGNGLQSNMRGLGKQDLGSNVSNEGRDGGDGLYLKSTDDGN